MEGESLAETRPTENGKIHLAGEKLYVETPVLYSHPLTKYAGFEVFLKLENLQPPGSFKLRGISHMIQKVKEK